MVDNDNVGDVDADVADNVVDVDAIIDDAEEDRDRITAIAVDFDIDIAAEVLCLIRLR